MTRNDTEKRDAPPEARLAYVHREQNALLITVKKMHGRNHRATDDRESSAELWYLLKSKYDVPEEESVKAVSRRITWS